MEAAYNMKEEAQDATSGFLQRRIVFVACKIYCLSIEGLLRADPYTSGPYQLIVSKWWDGSAFSTSRYGAISLRK